MFNSWSTGESKQHHIVLTADAKKTLSALVQDMDSKGLKPVEYGQIGEVLFWSLANCLGKDMYEKIHEHWVKLFSQVLSFVVHKAVASSLKRLHANSNRSPSIAAVGKYLGLPCLTAHIQQYYRSLGDIYKTRRNSGSMECCHAYSEKRMFGDSGKDSVSSLPDYDPFAYNKSFRSVKSRTNSRDCDATSLDGTVESVQRQKPSLRSIVSTSSCSDKSSERTGKEVFILRANSTGSCSELSREISRGTPSLRAVVPSNDRHETRSNDDMVILMSPPAHHSRHRAVSPVCFSHRSKDSWGELEGDRSGTNKNASGSGSGCDENSVRNVYSLAQFDEDDVEDETAIEFSFTQSHYLPLSAKGFVLAQ
jgi:hypothetical protein